MLWDLLGLFRLKLIRQFISILVFWTVAFETNFNNNNLDLFCNSPILKLEKAIFFEKICCVNFTNLLCSNNFLVSLRIKLCLKRRGWKFFQRLFKIIATKYVLITYLQPNIFFYSLVQTRYSPVYVSSYFHREVHLIPDRTRANVLKPDPQQLQPEARRSWLDGGKGELAESLWRPGTGHFTTKFLCTINQ